jgi:alanine racemase
VAGNAPQAVAPKVQGSGPAFDLAGCTLTIDLGALAGNWRALAALCAPARCAAVVKADAYGLGIAHAVPALAEAGCTDFFVATIPEGIAVRAAADARVFVLSARVTPETAHALREHRLIPVLNTTHDIACWEAEGWHGGAQLPAALHVDTGMNRLGVTPAEAARFAQENALTRAIHLPLVMSHLACADEPGHAMNARQLESFQRVAALFPQSDSSLSNSAGIGLGPDCRAALVRAGIVLYGAPPVAALDGVVRPVATARARILQLRQAMAGEIVGYGAATTLSRDTTLAVTGAGYADGLLRAASGAGVDQRAGGTPGAQGWIAGHRVPVIGRISMDLTIFDVTDVPAGTVNEGDFIELFGNNVPVEDFARAAGTIPYEVLTSLGRRYHREYVRGEA